MFSFVFYSGKDSILLLKLITTINFVKTTMFSRTILSIFIGEVMEVRGLPGTSPGNLKDKISLHFLNNGLNLGFKAQI